MKIQSSAAKLGSLRCRLIDALPDNSGPTKIVVLCHGFGAPGDDLVDFGPMLLERSEAIARSCRFVFPEAPIDLGALGMPGGRAWWPINMARLAEMQQTRNFHDLTDLEPPGMAEATATLRRCIDEVLNQSGLKQSDLIIGGFSQGAMVSTNATLTGLCPAVLALFSGTLLNKTEWARLAGQHPCCRVVQSHGFQDPLLPMAVAIELKNLLSDAGFDVSFTEFQGGHTIPMSALSALQLAIESQL